MHQETQRKALNVLPEDGQYAYMRADARHNISEFDTHYFFVFSVKRTKTQQKVTVLILFLYYSPLQPFGTAPVPRQDVCYIDCYILVLSIFTHCVS